MQYSDMKRITKRVWRFLWHDDSWSSWLVNVVLAFVLIKFVIYPGLGLLLGTGFPIVAVISSSMEHDGSFNRWWDRQSAWYEQHNVSREEFLEFPFRNGFNKGDIMVLVGAEPADIQQGEIIVFKSSIRPDPIIHRVIAIRNSGNGDQETKREKKAFRFQTKGDHNIQSYPFEQDIGEDVLVGKAVFRVPLLGYVKIWFVDVLRLLHIVQ